MVVVGHHVNFLAGVGHANRRDFFKGAQLCKRTVIKPAAIAHAVTLAVKGKHGNQQDVGLNFRRSFGWNLNIPAPQDQRVSWSPLPEQQRCIFGNHDWQRSYPSLSHQLVKKLERGNFGAKE